MLIFLFRDAETLADFAQANRRPSLAIARAAAHPVERGSELAVRSEAGKSLRPTSAAIGSTAMLGK